MVPRAFTDWHSLHEQQSGLKMIYGKIVVMDAKPTPKAKKWILRCVALNVCVCGCGKPQLKRGLAQNCYYAWYAQREALGTAEKQAAYDARLIRGGKLLAPGSARQLRRSDVFAKAAAEVA
jgi:hypothetical protein